MVQRISKKSQVPGDEAAGNESSAAIGSLSRGLEIIEVLIEAQTCLTLSDVASQAGLDTSTVLRLLNTLIDRGYAVRDEGTKRYLAGPRALAPAPLFHPIVALRREAHQILKSVVTQTGQSCALVLYVGNERLVVDFFRGKEELSPYYDTWLKTPRHATASGKLLLAWLSESERLAVLGPGPYAGYTPTTITEPAELEKQLALIRRDGYAVTRGEYPDFVGVAAPFMLPIHSRPMGCVVLSSTGNLLPVNMEGEIVAAAKSAAATLLNTVPSLHLLKSWTKRAERKQTA